ncbi:MAG: hypothetical protein ACFFFC_17800 [Candidatus Thorarchaeota archaeon]
MSSLQGIGMDPITISNVMIVVSFVAHAFLFYTLVNLETLQISVTHQRVLVELTIFVVLLLVGLYLRFGLS